MDNSPLDRNTERSSGWKFYSLPPSSPFDDRLSAAAFDGIRIGWRAVCSSLFRARRRLRNFGAAYDRLLREYIGWGWKGAVAIGILHLWENRGQSTYPVRKRNGAAHFGLSLASLTSLSQPVYSVRHLKDNISSEFVFSWLVALNCKAEDFRAHLW